MASEFMDADRFGGLWTAAGHLHDMQTAMSRSGFESASDKFRHWSDKYGLDPRARRTLQWEVARGEEAEKKRTGRAPKREKSDEGGGDPRMALVK